MKSRTESEKILWPVELVALRPTLPVQPALCGVHCIWTHNISPPDASPGADFGRCAAKATKPIAGFNREFSPNHCR
jgi:hypothetical protein